MATRSQALRGNKNAVGPHKGVKHAITPLKSKGKVIGNQLKSDISPELRATKIKEFDALRTSLHAQDPAKKYENVKKDIVNSAKEKVDKIKSFLMQKKEKSYAEQTIEGTKKILHGIQNVESKGENAIKKVYHEAEKIGFANDTKIHKFFSKRKTHIKRNNLGA